MLWLEMSRDPTHGGGSWGFGRSLWAPTRKRGTGTTWGFWETLLRVRRGDSVLHLRGIGDQAALVGFSTAERDGFETSTHPPSPGQWGYADRFYRVPLKDYKRFPEPIRIRDVLSRQDALLREYVYRNRAKHRSQRRRLFCVVQAGRLQCLNGAYLSELDDELAGILLGPDYSSDQLPAAQPPNIAVETGERIRQLSTRLGQKAFSDGVRSNYNHQCCFPGCSVTEASFLVGGHITRWADTQLLRGRLENGICLCLMHDKAFEQGFFTLARDLRVAVNMDHSAVARSVWCQEHLIPHNGQRIRQGRVTPSLNALRGHWERVSYRPEG